MPEVLSEILKDSEGYVYKLDEDARVMDVNGSSVVFDIDEFAHIETAADGTQTIWTPQGEKELVAAPEYTTASLEAAGFGAEKNPQSATVEAQNIVVTG